MPASKTDSHYLALDMGEKRVGVAIASEKTRLASPLITLINDPSLIEKLKGLITEYSVQNIVVGLPKLLDGSESRQTVLIREYIEQLKRELKVNIVTEDEALSSVRAEDELRSRGKMFSKAEIDKLAACLILEDYLSR